MVVNFLTFYLAEADIKQTNADSTSPSEKDVRLAENVEHLREIN